MSVKTRIIPCLYVKDGGRRPQRQRREDAQIRRSVVP
jgi:imidazole glycerol phosphate synthase subunit HisF